MTNINLPACTYIGDGAFVKCANLESIKLISPEVVILGGREVFSKSTKIYVPTNLLEMYKTAEEWSEIADQIYSFEIQKGDVNGDGEISVTDISLQVEILQGKIDAEPYMAVADVDGDGELTEMDCTALADMVVTRDIESYEDITITWKYPNINPDISDAPYHIGYEGGESTPLITKVSQRVKYNNNTYGTITIFENSAGVLLQDLPSNIGLEKENISFTFNESYSGVSIDSKTGKITADMNTDESPDFKILTVVVTGKLNGIPFSSTVLFNQDNVNRYIWCGYSGATPTSFEDCGVATRYVADDVYNGTDKAIVDTLNGSNIKCHWIMIPQNSAYRLLSVEDDDSDITDIGKEVTVNGNHSRIYNMWHLTTNRNYRQTSTFKLASK